MILRLNFRMNDWKTEEELLPQVGMESEGNRPTDRGSNDGPCWSTVVHVRGWVKEVLIHGHRPRTVV
ncbi:hypothetical protein MTR67_051161 [Solanum verrucosum]|uniref:Uncharacterized protein n=1 Tax=Solanum verrucosum TaxID=315347 RepID=A0AAF0V6V4_SOLVR|nr:hypothetical protein MTR67_051161 [Solanum verrucosum]